MEQNQIEQNIRLRKLLKVLKINQSDFGKSLGMTQSNISRMTSGGNKVSVEVLNRMADKYQQVNLHWLLTGVGEMFLNTVENMSPQVDKELVDGKEKLEELKEIVSRLEEAVRELKVKLDIKPDL
jgi:transcriptional regulator with XRE-family HTH domain